MPNVLPRRTVVPAPLAAVAVAVAAVAAVALVGCSGGLAVRSSGASSSGASSSGASSSGAAPVSVPPVPAPPSAGTTSVTPAVPGCPAGAVTASGAPFCYERPAGFHDDSARPDYAYGWQWRTLVSAGEHDLVEVLGQAVKTRLSALDDAGAKQFVAQLALQPDALHVLTASPLTQTTVAGVRAFEQDATYRADAPGSATGGSTAPSSAAPAPASSGPPSSDPSDRSMIIAVHDVTVLASGVVVQISCQSTPARASVVAAACTQVQGSLRLG
ncbi:MAG: hypothetical protein ACTHMS_14495 [Jatrophihabitans sp.]|uniref:hypothetical protein n=1 Tax=Jatrophihabitans sp. TaxID=1932789 RepID=UPI003F805595